MRRIATATGLAALGLAGGLAGVMLVSPTLAAAGRAPAPTCAGERATIVDRSKAGDRIVGTRRRDVIVAGRGKGRDVVEGLGGDDVICGDARTVVRGGRGDDLIVAAGRADGGRGDDLFHAVGTARGGRGSDAYLAPLATGSFDGGADHDVVTFYAGYVPGVTSGVYVNLALGMASAELESGGARIRTGLAGVEEVRGTPDDDLLLGDALDNVLRGGAGKDVLNGRAGYDTVVGGRDKDVCTGEVREGCEE
ncbi:hypothetical protein ACJ5H2_00585 [Nocardioides sp. R1-1]|uniref:hypothetical protein n=1 Tax=Nocardioides sp. R1-1 TaxID=3383502 RepID=UPI0038D05EAA